jgi:hypothetical protein
LFILYFLKTFMYKLSKKPLLGTLTENKLH